MRIAGACGRLMCCLKYEHPLYVDFKERVLRLGSGVESPEGVGTVVGYSVPSDQVIVRVAETGQRCACPRASVCGSRQEYEAPHGPARGGTEDR
jgi:cell fate regulator YaaT (PSP1 superfamily)